MWSPYEPGALNLGDSACASVIDGKFGWTIVRANGERERHVLDRKSMPCCEDGGGHIVWRESDSYYGPEKTGWAAPSGTVDYEDLAFTNVFFCPFCGVKLPD